MTLNERLTAHLEGIVFALFLIGARMNKPVRIHSWLSVTRAMPRMIREVYSRPELGFLLAETWFSRSLSIIIERSRFKTMAILNYSIGLALALSMLLISTYCRSADNDTPTPNDGGDWRTYNKSLDSQRYSPLDQINVTNAASVSEVCRLRIADRGSFQAGLVMVNGTLFATTATDTIAIDATNCSIKWRQSYAPEQPAALPLNRGVAYLNGRIFRGTPDARLIALDALSGNEIWRSNVGDPRAGEEITGAPLAWNGQVVVGTAISDLGVRGRIVAFDASTGRELWRFSTIPLGNEIGAKSWKNRDWARHGGGGIWSTMTVDVTTGELFIPVGNPVPDFLPAARPGNNLFTNSVLVLDGTTGHLKWWYQLTPRDGRDYDLGAAPMLYRNSLGKDVVAAASKDGYLYLVDRSTHELLHKTAVTTVDALPLPPTPSGVLSCPGTVGGTEWNGPAIDLGRRTLFVGAVDHCQIIHSAPGVTWQSGGLNYGGTWSSEMNPATGWITAVDSDTGQIRWKYHAEAPVLAAVTPTAGGIVLGGDNSGNFLVLNSDTGAVLKMLASGGSLAGGVITYEQLGRQYIAFDSGNASRTAFGVVGRPTLVILALPDSAGAKRVSPNSESEHGKRIYMTTCAFCHGLDGKTIGGFDLSSIKSRMSKQQLVNWITHPAPPMPHVFPEPLEREDELDIQAVTDFLLQWNPQK